MTYKPAYVGAFRHATSAFQGGARAAFTACKREFTRCRVMARQPLRRTRASAPWWDLGYGE